jgi:hypothetical protein
MTDVTFGQRLAVPSKATVRYREGMRRLLFPLFLTACGLTGQTTPPHSLAELALSDLAALNSSPDLAAWQKSHPNERLKNAAYDYEYEGQGLWCAASVADFALAGGINVTRQAFFYVPSETTGNPLPARLDTSLVRQCRLLAFWYEVKKPTNPAGLAETVAVEVGASLGSGEDPPTFKRKDSAWGSGTWTRYTVWDRGDHRVILGVDPYGSRGTPGGADGRLLLISRSSRVPRVALLDWFGTETPKGQLPLDGSGESADVARLEKPCSFDDGHNNWQIGEVRLGDRFLRDFPESRWKPYIHLTLARTYAAWLILTYPSVELMGASVPADPDRLRVGAISHFRAFLEENPESPEAHSAWREAWRMLAGLPPSPIHFGCTD